MMIYLIEYLVLEMPPTYRKGEGISWLILSLVSAPYSVLALYAYLSN
jgi:hypothetical protein